MWKNIVETRREYGVYASHAGYLRLQTHTLRLRNTQCFSIATIVARTRVSVTLYVPDNTQHTTLTRQTSMPPDWIQTRKSGQAIGRKTTP